MYARWVTISAMCLCVDGVAAAQERQTRDLERSVPAEQVKSIRLEGGVGKIRINAGSANAAIIRVALKAKPDRTLFGIRGRGDVDAVELRTEVRGGELRVSLGGDRDNIEERWEVEVPARLESKVELKVGEIEFRDLRGGTELVAGVGEIDAEVPEGDVRASTSVGDIRVRTATSSYSDVTVSANVGDAKVTLGGRSIERTRRPGPGHRITIEGLGRDRIRLRAGVGSASLAIVARAAQ